MRINTNRYYSLGIRLEKLKQKTCILQILSRLLLILAMFVSYCLRNE